MLLQLLFGFGVSAVVLAMFSLYSGYLRTEGFLNVPNSLFVSNVTPGGSDESSVLSPGSAMNGEKLLETLPAMSNEEAERNWAQMTSERCYRSDIGESLKKTRNLLQRTNNYKREHPDSCSAPNHEFVGTFYTPFEGVGRNPAMGTNYPPSTQACPY